VEAVPTHHQRLLEGPAEPNLEGWFDMDRFMKLARSVAGKSSIVRDERGLTTVEYVIILVLLAVTAISVWNTFGDSVKKQVGTSTTAIDELGTEKPTTSK
jgi:Flp pilus assembly pilin Flp